MTGTLREAKEWCDGIRKSARVLGALGQKHWDGLDWSVTKPLGRDESLRHVEAADLLRWSSATLRDLDDFCVLVLFSVFEAAVRNRVQEVLRRELSNVQHLVALAAIGEAAKAVETDSFFRVQSLFKQVDHNLVEQVNQVRQYRNWVAHGRRGDPPKDNVSPNDAFERLDRFMGAVDAAGT